MAIPAQLHPSAVKIPPPELHEAVILDTATEPGQEVRCTGAWLGSQHASDPMDWESVVTADGEYWPHKEDRALVSAHVDGPPVILWWAPAPGREPDVAIGSSDALGVIVHGDDPNVPRGKSHDHYVWIGTVRPNYAADIDLLAKYA